MNLTRTDSLIITNRTDHPMDVAWHEFLRQDLHFHVITIMFFIAISCISISEIH